MNASSEVTPLAECGMAAWTTLRTPVSEVAQLRKNPGIYRGDSNPAAALKLVDDQTVVAVAAVLQAMAIEGWEGRSFHDWGVVAAPQFLGRARCAAAQYRFSQQQVRGVSPLLAPHLSTHAVAASISIALSIRGPSFGTGGSPGQLRDALLTGMGLILQEDLPGVWVVLTQLVPEPAPDVTGCCKQPVDILGAALGLVAGTDQGAKGRLRLRPAAVAEPVAREMEIEDFCRFLESPGESPSWFCRLAAGLSMEIVGGPRPHAAAAIRAVS